MLSRCAGAGVLLIWQSMGSVTQAARGVCLAAIFQRRSAPTTAIASARVGFPQHVRVRLLVFGGEAEARRQAW